MYVVSGIIIELAKKKADKIGMACTPHNNLHHTHEFLVCICIQALYQYRDVNLEYNFRAFDLLGLVINV